MRRRDDARDELDAVAQRLRRERPEASPLELDEIKTAAMSRSRSRTAGRGRIGTRRLAVLGLTVGLLAATTGSVIAGQSSEPGGNAAIAQYGNNCDVNNNNGSIGSHNDGGNNGNESGNGNNYNCNENSFNQTINNYAGSTTTVNNNYTTVPASGSVLGSKSSKARTSGRRIRIHVRIPHGAKLRKVTVTVNGKHLKTLLGKKASTNIELVKLPCTSGATTVEISITLSDGKTVTARHSYHLCAS